MNSGPRYPYQTVRLDVTNLRPADATFLRGVVSLLTDPAYDPLAERVRSGASMLGCHRDGRFFVTYPHHELTPTPSH